MASRRKNDTSVNLLALISLFQTFNSQRSNFQFLKFNFVRFSNDMHPICSNNKIIIVAESLLED